MDELNIVIICWKLFLAYLSLCAICIFSLHFVVGMITLFEKILLRVRFINRVHKDRIAENISPVLAMNLVIWGFLGIKLSSISHFHSPRLEVIILQYVILVYLFYISSKNTPKKKRIKMDDKKLKSTIQLLADALEKENEMDYQPIVDMYLKKYPKDDNTDIEFFHAVMGYEIDKCKIQLVLAYFPEAAENRKLRNAILAWEDIYRIVGNFVKDIHGSSVCCMDCSRWIANQFVKYIESGQMPDMRKTEDVYWIPSFGTAEEWMQLCEGIVKLQYRDALQFSEALHDMKKKYAKGDITNEKILN